MLFFAIRQFIKLNLGCVPLMRSVSDIVDSILSKSTEYVDISIGKKVQPKTKHVSVVESNLHLKNELLKYENQKIEFEKSKFHQIILFYSGKLAYCKVERIKREFDHLLTGVILYGESNGFDMKMLQRTNKNKLLSRKTSENIHNEKVTGGILYREPAQTNSVIILNVHTLKLIDFLSKHKTTRIFKKDVEKVPDEKFKLKRKKLSFFQCKKKYFDRFRVIGQFNSQFILIRINRIILIIDQHALHERIQLERILRNRKRRFDLEVAKELACRNSIRFNTPLSEFKMNEIVRKVTNLKNPFICCHGRPSILHLFEL